MSILEGVHNKAATALVILLILAEKSYSFLNSGEEIHHRKVVIHVPVHVKHVTHTIYKVIEKPAEKATEKPKKEIIHHHHHGGTVDHMHQHSGKAGHHHEHVGHNAHSHKHAGLAEHHHGHIGSTHHDHQHKGHANHGHTHLGNYAHGHTHHGLHSHSHAHSGIGHHKHGHLGSWHHMHDHNGHYIHGHKHNVIADHGHIHAGYLDNEHKHDGISHHQHNHDSLNNHHHSNIDDSDHLRGYKLSNGLIYGRENLHSSYLNNNLIDNVLNHALHYDEPKTFHKHPFKYSDLLKNTESFPNRYSGNYVVQGRVRNAHNNAHNAIASHNSQQSANSESDHKMVIGYGKSDKVFPISPPVPYESPNYNIGHYVPEEIINDIHNEMHGGNYTSVNHGSNESGEKYSIPIIEEYDHGNSYEESNSPYYLLNNNNNPWKRIISENKWNLHTSTQSPYHGDNTNSMQLLSNPAVKSTVVKSNSQFVHASPYQVTQKNIIVP